MAANDIATHAGVYAQRLLDNEYAQKNLAQAAESLRAARRRASKRSAVLAANEELRNEILGGDTEPGPDSGPGTEAADPEVASVA